MKKALLIVAMVVSLWPVAAIAAGFASGTETTGTTATDGSDVPPDAYGPPETQPLPRPQAQIGQLNKLNRRVHTLLKRLDASPSLRGTADAALADRAHLLAMDLSIWRTVNAGRDRNASRFAAANALIASRVAKFAEAPSQDRLDAFNSAIRQYNRLLKERP